MKKAGLIFLAGALSGAFLMQQVMTVQPAAPANNTPTAAPVVQADPIAATTSSTPTAHQPASPDPSIQTEQAHQANQLNQCFSHRVLFPRTTVPFEGD